MDKVEPSATSLLNALQSGLKPAVKKANAREDAQKSRKSKFSQVLEIFAPADLGPLKELAPSEEAMTELMDAVHSAGSDLKDRPFPDEILRYKKAVRNFVHYVVENSYEIYKDQGIKKKVVVRGEAKWKDVVYHQVRVIDQKLEELAAAILSGQTNQLQRLSKMDEIAGLLVDLTISGAIKERDD
ncbi:MAG: YaaR family protein [Treponema sp.]|nr:YaaR family protein [Treponema sp.]